MRAVALYVEVSTKKINFSEPLFEGSWQLEFPEKELLCSV